MAKKKFVPMQHVTPPDVEELDRITRDLKEEQDAAFAEALSEPAGSVTLEKRKAGPGRPRTKPADRVKTSFFMPKELATRVKHATIDKGISQTDLIVEALEAYLAD